MTHPAYLYFLSDKLYSLPDDTKITAHHDGTNKHFYSLSSICLTIEEKSYPIPCSVVGTKTADTAVTKEILGAVSDLARRAKTIRTDLKDVSATELEDRVLRRIDSVMSDHASDAQAVCDRLEKALNERGINVKLRQLGCIHHKVHNFCTHMKDVLQGAWMLLDGKEVPAAKSNNRTGYGNVPLPNHKLPQPTALPKLASVKGPVVETVNKKTRSGALVLAELVAWMANCGREDLRVGKNLRALAKKMGMPFKGLLKASSARFNQVSCFFFYAFC